VFDTNWCKRAARGLITSVIAAVLILSLAACGDRTAPSGTPGDLKPGSGENAVKIAEVSPPQVIQELRQALETYQPQVAVLSPQPNEVLEDNTVTVQLQVQDLPIFKDPQLGQGPHLQVFLDNQPYQAVYDPNQPLIYKDLAPGTHTIRVFASRPWDESFKNEGAYAQTTFHIFTKTDDNSPNPDQPLLTYSSPQASYGAEPIMLDFYLTNAPLHLVAQENPEDDIADWRIRCTINGESFIIDEWQPIYLTGFKPGKNWVQLELLDELGNPVNNAFNNIVRLITYEPNGTDTLSQLVRGELSAALARGIVDPNYTPKTPEPTPTPTLEPAVEATPAPTPTLEPAVEATPAPTPTPEPAVEATPAPTPTLEPAVEATPAPTPTLEPETVAPTAPTSEETPATPTVEVEPTKPAETEPIAPKALEKPRFGGFFNWFRRPDTAQPSPTPPAPNAIATPTPPLTPPPAVQKPEMPAFPKALAPETPTLSPTKLDEKESDKSESFDRLKSPSAVELQPAPSLPPTLPEIIETPTPPLTPPPAVQKPEMSPFPKALAPETPPLSPTKLDEKESDKSESFDRLKSPSAVELQPYPSLPPTLPEIIQTPTPQSIAPSTPPSPPETPISPKAEPTETPQEAKSGELSNPASIPTIIEVETTPSLPPTLPEIIETPTPEEISVRSKSLPQIDSPASQTEPKAEVTKTPEAKPNQSVETAQESPKSSGTTQIYKLFQRFREPRTPIQ